MSSDPDGSPRPERPESPRPGRKWAAGVAALVVVFVALAGYDLISGGVALAGRPSASRTATGPAPGPATTAAARSATPVPSSAPSVSSSPAPSESARVLTVASATAYGPDGVTDGDHPNLAPGIINGGDGQAWHSSWYTTPEFGNLQSGTGLLFDMGETVTVSRVRLVLGAPVGADIQVQVENTVLPAELPVAASASDVGGTVQLRLTTPASGRYVLVWFTRLPPNSNGENQVDVYSATVYGT